nr:hypothetical protein [Agrobacterium tumefaciens]
MGQLGKARAVHHAGNGLDLLGLLCQLWMLLKLLSKITRIGMTEPARERIGDQLCFLERDLAIGRRAQLIDKLLAQTQNSIKFGGNVIHQRLM